MAYSGIPLYDARRHPLGGIQLGSAPVWMREAKGQALLLALPILALVLIVLLRDGGPTYRSDEIAYLGSAAALAGKQNALAGSWYAGYAIVLSPLFRLSTSVRDAWPAVVVVNGLALIVCSLCLWTSLQRSRATDRNRAFRLVLLSMLVFGTTACLGWAFTNCLLMALVAAAALLLSSASIGLRQALGVGLLLGYAGWIHPTGLLLVLAASLACLWTVPGRRRCSHSLIILSIGIATSFTYLRAVHPWVTALQGGAHGHYEQQIGSLIQQLRQMPLETISNLAIGVINGLATSAIASFGFVGVPVAALLQWQRQPAASERMGAGLRRVLLFLLLAWGLLVLFSAALLPHDPSDLQLAFHHRYSQPVLPGLVVYGMALTTRPWRDRLQVWLISAIPIVLALLIAVFLRQYNDNFSVIDQLGAVTFFLDPDNVPLMLLTGLAVTAAVQFLSWRAFLPLAAGFSLLGWQRMDQMQRDILYSDSRPPAMAEAAAVLAQAGIHPCIDLESTPSTRPEHDRLMRYYLSGQPVSVVSVGQRLPQRCGVLIRPADSERETSTRIRPASDPVCRPVLADSHSREVLEDCRSRTSRAGPSLERMLLPARRDLVSLARVRQLQPPGYGIAVLLHSDDLPPGQLRDRAWWRTARVASTARALPADKTLYYGPYAALPAGDYLAVYDGFSLTSGSVEMEVTSGEGKRSHAKLLLTPGSGPAAVRFSLDRGQDVEVILRTQASSVLRLPDVLVIFGNPPDPASPWSVAFNSR